MAKFLNTRKAVSEIEDLMRTAEEKLILISPYLKLSKDFKELLTYRNKKDKITTIVFGKQELKPDEMKFLEELRFVSLKYNENLHAKCYSNEKKMVITSLNLYEFSMANNKEMGVLIEKDDECDIKLFNEAHNEIDYIIDTSESFKFKSSYDDETHKKNKDYRIKDAEATINNKGYCIRCNQSIPLNPLAPYCKNCYNIWKQFENSDYEEEFCHICGKAHKSTMLKPTCYNCYKKHKDIFKLSS